MYGGLSAKERLAQLQQKGSKDSAAATSKPGTASKTPGKVNNDSKPVAEKAALKKEEPTKLAAKEPAQAKEESKKPEPSKPKEETKKPEPPKPKEEPKEPPKPKEESKKPELPKPKEEPKKTETEKPKEEPKKPEPPKPKEELKKPEPPKPKEEAKKPEPLKSKAEPKEPPKPKEEPKKPEPQKPKEEPKEPPKSNEEAKKTETEKPKEEPKKPEPPKPKEEAKKTETEKPKEEPKKPEIKTSAPETKATEIKQAKPADQPSNPQPSQPPQNSPAVTATQPATEGTKKPEEAQKSKEEPNKEENAVVQSSELNKAMDSKPTEKPADPPKSVSAPEAKPQPLAANQPPEAAKKPEGVITQAAKPTEQQKKLEEKPPASQSTLTPSEPAKASATPAVAAPQAAIKVESVAPAAAPAQLQVVQVPANQSAPPPQVTAQATAAESLKSKQPEFKPAQDDFYTNIFYFSGMGSLIGSALAEGVYVPEKNQRNALEAEEVEQMKAKKGGRKEDQIIVTARHQAQGLSTDFRQLQSLLESLPTFTDALETKPLDKRAIDEPIHAHVYFSHEQQQRQRSQPQQQLTEPQRTYQDLHQTIKYNYITQDGVGDGSGVSQHHQPQHATSVQGHSSGQHPYAAQDGRTGSTTSQYHQSQQYPVDNRAAVAGVQSHQQGQYPFPAQSGGAGPSTSQFHQPHQPPSTSRDLNQDTYGSKSGSNMIDSIDQFDRAFAADAAKSTTLPFGTTSTPQQSSANRYANQRYEAAPNTNTHYPSGGASREQASVTQGKPTSSASPYADHSAGTVDASGIKPWQLSHLRSLEAKGYNIVSEQEKSLREVERGGPHHLPDAYRGTGARSPYQAHHEQPAVEYTPVVAVKAKTSGSINHPYAASLEMPYCDL